MPTSQWDVKITTPHGTNGHMVFDAGATQEAVVQRFAEFVAQMDEADVNSKPTEFIDRPGVEL